MKYKTAFRLARKAIGILTICNALPWLTQAVAAIGLEFLGGGFGIGSSMIGWEVSHLIGHAFSLCVGLYLFFGGAWIVNRAIPSNLPYCPECGYQLTGLPDGGACPECGTSPRGGARDVQIPPPTT